MFQVLITTKRTSKMAMRILSLAALVLPYVDAFAPCTPGAVVASATRKLPRSTEPPVPPSSSLLFQILLCSWWLCIAAQLDVFGPWDSTMTRKNAGGGNAQANASAPA